MTLSAIAAAQSRGDLSAAAGEHLRRWLTEPCYAPFVPAIEEHVAQGRWRELDEAFWTVIPFGTGGRRGRMYPIGPNAINERTIGESAQGLAEYVREAHGGKSGLGCAIAYDTRHRSREFAELCAEVMVAAGFQVHFLDGFHSTPALSYCVRRQQCACGIMVTASHNPPSDNAVKCYWSTGGQLLPPHDQRVIERVLQVREIHRTPFAAALESGQIRYCQAEVDADFQAAVLAQGASRPRDLRVLYSPLHGVGAGAILPTLAADGFSQVEVYGPHAAPDGDFPNVPGHVANPENAEAFTAPIAFAREARHELVVATDPDCDRLGAAAPRTRQADSEWITFNGNQLCGLLCDYVLERRRAGRTLSPEHYVVKTLVTTSLVERIAESYGVRIVGDLQVGFKWIAGVIDALGPDRFVFGCEESHGFMAGSYVRDKDGVVATMLLCELAADLKARGQTLSDKLDALYWQHGCHLERQVNLLLPGADGQARREALMQEFRTSPPSTLGGTPVARVRDYRSLTAITPGLPPAAFTGPKGDLLIFDLGGPDIGEGNRVAVRPSGTEPKLKVYLFACEPPERLANLTRTKADLALRLAEIECDLKRRL